MHFLGTIGPAVILRTFSAKKKKEGTRLYRTGATNPSTSSTTTAANPPNHSLLPHINRHNSYSSRRQLPRALLASEPAASPCEPAASPCESAASPCESAASAIARVNQLLAPVNRLLALVNSNYYVP